MHGQLYRKPWRSTRRLPGRSMLYANHWSVWEHNVCLALPQCMDNCLRNLEPRCSARQLTGRPMLHADHLWVWEQIILLALPQCMDNCTGNNGAVPAGGPAGPCCMPITGRYGTRMFFSRFHNAWIAAIFANTRYGSRMFFWCFQIAWLTVSEASVQCPPANRPAGAARRSLVGMGATCTSGGSKNAWATVQETVAQYAPPARPVHDVCQSLVGMGAECSSRVSTMHG